MRKRHRGHESAALRLPVGVAGGPSSWGRAAPQTEPSRLATPACLLFGAAVAFLLPACTEDQLFGVCDTMEAIVVLKGDGSSPALLVSRRSGRLEGLGSIDAPIERLDEGAHGLERIRDDSAVFTHTTLGRSETTLMIFEMGTGRQRVISTCAGWSDVRLRASGDPVRLVRWCAEDQRLQGFMLAHRPLHRRAAAGQALAPAASPSPHGAHRRRSSRRRAGRHR